MRDGVSNNKQEQFITKLSRLWMDQQDRVLIAKIIQELDTHYDLNRKIEKEPGVEEIIEQMLGRLANSYPSLSNTRNKRILDIACGSNTSKLPASLYVNTPFGEMSFGHASRGYTALFEPWFCRIMLELEATPVGVDFGNLEQELFIHYRVDLGKPGALDFLPDHSFDGIQDSRLFGSPEFTTEFPHPADRLKVAQELIRQEQRLLKLDGIIIHSDATALLR
jgi:SAM-dependent methyltransferase